MSELNELHERITQQIIEETNQEMAESITEKRAAVKAAKQQEQKAMKAFKEAGLDISKLDALDREFSTEAEKELKAIEAQMDKESEEPSTSMIELDVESSFLPPEALVLTPDWTATFSDQDDQDKLTGGASSAPSQARITAGGGCKNWWNWARGGGWGCTGGVGQRTDALVWSFWFRPRTSKFYSIRPLFKFRGYYIVESNDKWYNCKWARVKVTARTRVWQYNWKPWTNVDVLYVSDDNIKVNRRFDTDRHTYNTALLGGGDWACIKCRVDLHVYAKGSESYAKNDFSTGNANEVCVPYVNVY